MNSPVDRVMASYENSSVLDQLGREEIRLKVGQYLAKLSSAGHSDAEELTFFGLAYLRILHEGPDIRDHGCVGLDVIDGIAVRWLRKYSTMLRLNI